MSFFSKKLRAWLELLRVPNLLTVPGDPLAGYLLSGGVAVSGHFHVVPVALSSICLYCFGLIMNDLADSEIDRCERPGRPIPSGRISAVSGRIASIFFLVWGLAMAWLTGRDAGIVATVLAGAVTSYNVVLKKRPLAGPVSMGACRGLSMMMGAAAGGGIDYRVALAIAGLTLYVAAFTSIARFEMQRVVFGARRWLPGIVLGCMFAGLFLNYRNGLEDVWFAVKVGVPAVISVGLAFMCGRRLLQARDVPGVIGGFIANIMLVQACLCAMAGEAGQMAGALIACMVPLFVVSTLKFYSS
jgi:4-hydroxybenzoate polyprenyltransferase